MAVTSMRSSSIRDFVKYRNMSTAFGVSPYAVEYVVIAGGGGGGADASGGVVLVVIAPMLRVKTLGVGLLANQR